jgi:serine/threonine protein kinase
MRIAVQLVKGICYLHERGIIHGDLKPENILVSERHEVWITDFGSVRLEGLDQKGFNSGTMAFQSPQRLRDKKCSLRDDIWALGIVLWWMKFGSWIEDTHEYSLLDFQFFWSRYQKGVLSLPDFPLSTLCWDETNNVTIYNVMKALNVTFEVKKMYWTEEWWYDKVSKGLDKRGASYNRQELMNHIKACWEYVWLDGPPVDPSILYHMLHISDIN